MSPKKLTELALRDTPLLHTTDTVAGALQKLLDRRITALPVVDEQDQYAGIFGEREFIAALFPGYVKDLKGAVPQPTQPVSIEEMNEAIAAAAAADAR